MSDYTPTTVDVRVRYALDRGSAIQRPFSTAIADFDRWLQAHDAKVRAEQREQDIFTAQIVLADAVGMAGGAVRLGAQIGAAIRAVPANTNTEEGK